MRDSFRLAGRHDAEAAGLALDAQGVRPAQSSAAPFGLNW